VSKICTEYRQKFKTDIFIDIICYRKHGHNEADEPAFTQPILYKKIKAHASPREIYEETLVKSGVLTREEAQAMIDRITQGFNEAQKLARAEPQQPHVSTFDGAWKGLKAPDREALFKPVNTAVDESTLKALGTRLNAVPSGFNVHPKLVRFLEGRQKAIQDGKGIDWGNGEALAFATLLGEGFPVRLSGQDAERGTFSHRQSVLHDVETGEVHVPLNQVATDQARFEVYNSHLSEMGVLGFEYGYSLADPKTLTIWEAQFGDFANGAQVIIDQFITTSESKWQRMTGLVMLLPHGYEGQGPEHSSARLERFLQLAGRDNIFVMNLTTPANLFHALRRQVRRDFRKPMIVMSPKSLLRHPLAISSLSDFTDGSFQEVIDDPSMPTGAEAKKVRRTLICTGKVYYDLVNERATLKRDDVAIIRLEQPYPFPAERLAEAVGRYKNSDDTVWVQEEPRNMGAWSYIFGIWHGGLGPSFAVKAENRALRYVGREIGAAPAVGSAKVHETEQRALLEKAFGEKDQ
jgi:2-oxoglutarate dehydrogenase E1 component